MATANFLVADPDLLPSGAAREAARDYLRAAPGHWRTTTTDEPDWAGPYPTCPHCGVVVDFFPPTPGATWRCRRCNDAFGPLEFAGGYTRFSIWLFADLDPAQLESLRAGLSVALGVAVRAARNVGWDD